MRGRILKNVTRPFYYLTCCLLLLFACSEIETKWSRKFDALGPGDYRINSIDGSKEEFYLTGTYTEENGNAMCFTAKYDSKGRLQWHKIFDAENSTQTMGTAILTIVTQEELLTEHRDIYVLVKTVDENGKQQAILAKYDTLGNLDWQKTVTAHDGPLTSSLLSDHQGNLYVAGWEQDNENRPTIYIGKYTDTGQTSWFTKYYNEELDFEQLRFDISGPEYFVIAGILKNTGDLFYLKYDGSGQFLGSVKYETEKKIKNLSDLRIDPVGNSYLSATIWDQGTDDDFLTIAYNKDDSLLWASEYDGLAHGNDMSNAIALDESLNTYIVGSSEDMQGIPGILAVKYDKSGDQIWVQRLERKSAASPLMIEPRYLHLGHRPQMGYFYISGTAGNDALITRLNTSGVYSFQAEYGERGRVTVPTALSSRCMAFLRTTENSSDAYIVTIGPSAILGIARWD
jgi:predicted component of type VI protein secretion system